MSQRQICVTVGEHGPDATCIRCDHEGPTVAGFDRAKAIARVCFLMPALTESGLGWLVAQAEFAAAIYPRDLRSGTLAAEQQARYAVKSDDEAPPPKSRTCTVNRYDEAPCGERAVEWEGIYAWCKFHGGHAPPTAEQEAAWAAMAARRETDHG